MQLSESVYIVAGGDHGLGISEAYDSTVYLLDVGSELALIDAGCGIDPGPTVENIERHGYDPAGITHILLTHCHADHAGAAGFWRERTGAVATPASLPSKGVPSSTSASASFSSSRN